MSSSSPTIDSILREAAKRLSPFSESPRLDAELLLAHAMSCSREDLYKRLFSPVSDSQVTAFDDLLAERIARRPVAQLTAQRSFWNFTVGVSNATLIPRPETELLVEQALARIPAQGKVRVLDLGTGSGIVALAIARERPEAGVTATDISPQALAVARQNAHDLRLGHIEFRQGDWYKPLGKRLFDVIVSNPPYIADDEWKNTDPELEHEPSVALKGGRDGLTALRAVVNGAPKHLVVGGWLLVEHGATQADEVQSLMRAAGLKHVVVYADGVGRPRVTAGSSPG